MQYKLDFAIVISWFTLPVLIPLALCISTIWIGAWAGIPMAIWFVVACVLLYKGPIKGDW